MLTLAGALLAADPAVTKARKEIAEKKYDDAITGLEAAHKKTPASAEVSKALADAYLAKADSLMADEQLPPRMKYPPALKAYRQVLTYDKANKRAQAQIASIEGIYKSMGRPIPQ
jgi:tetratricopeptide (TPR) repeat protein